MVDSDLAAINTHSKNKTTMSPDTENHIAEIIIDLEIWQRMRNEVSRLSPQEACGILGGRVENNHFTEKHRSWAMKIFPIENMLHSLVRYQMEPKQQLHAFNELEKQNLNLVAIYHSHPTGPDFPSPRDVAEAFYPEVIHLIWSPKNEIWECHAFLINEAKISPVILTINPSHCATF